MRTVTMQWSCLAFDYNICTGPLVFRCQGWLWESPGWSDGTGALSPLGCRLVWWSSLYPLATEHWNGLCGSLSRDEVSHPKDTTDPIWEIKCLYKEFFLFWVIITSKNYGNRPQEKFYLARSSTSTKSHAKALNILSHLATKCCLPWRQCLWIPINFFIKYSSSVSTQSC